MSKERYFLYIDAFKGANAILMLDEEFGDKIAASLLTQSS
jgi:hypothetical protein